MFGYRFFLLLVAICFLGTASAVYHYSSHPGAYHKAVHISPFAETVTGQDGTVWSIAYTDRYKVLGWLPSDVLVIVPNRSWFSSYDFYMINENTGESIDAYIMSGPKPAGQYTFQIIEIDYDNNIVRLDDSTWALSSDDETLVKQWKPDDFVIIGINDGWNSSIRPNILINVRLQKYATANCLSFE